MAKSPIAEIEPWRIRPLTKLVYSQPFELLIAFVILINATSLAILTMPDLDPNVKDACEQIDLICFAIYGGELVLRILSYGKKPWMFFKQGWNIFDFIVIAASPLLSGQTAVLRLLRLLRLVRIFRFLPEVRCTHHINHSLTSTAHEPCSSYLRCALYVRNAWPLSLWPR